MNVADAPADEPAFGAPWQAQAFALTLQLYRAGHFTWPEWSARLAAEIERGGAEDAGADGYYRCWLTALEGIVSDKALVSGREIDERRHRLG